MKNTQIDQDGKLQLPSIEEQQKIANVLDNVENKIKLVEQQLADLKQEKKALMEKYFPSNLKNK